MAEGEGEEVVDRLGFTERGRERLEEWLVLVLEEAGEREREERTYTRRTDPSDRIEGRSPEDVEDFVELSNYVGALGFAFS